MVFQEPSASEQMITTTTSVRRNLCCRLTAPFTALLPPLSPPFHAPFAAPITALPPPFHCPCHSPVSLPRVILSCPCLQVRQESPCRRSPDRDRACGRARSSQTKAMSAPPLKMVTMTQTCNPHRYLLAPSGANKKSFRGAAIQHLFSAASESKGLKRPFHPWIRIRILRFPKTRRG